MRFHDVICDEDGWSHHVDGVKGAVFPSWFLAVHAARRAADRDLRKGVLASVRCQGADGEMEPVHHKVLPASGLRTPTRPTPPRPDVDARLAG
jgi:hypothetical protein